MTHRFALGEKRSLAVAAHLIFLLTAPAFLHAGASFVGNKECRTCHPDVFLNFYKNPHARSEISGCEGCHGPGSEHIAAHGGKSTIRAFSQLKPREVLDACLSCHNKDSARVNIRRSPHTEAGVACTSCHSIHKAVTPERLLAKVQREICYDCHPSARAQFEMPVHHRVNEGVVQCTDCHNPHGSFVTPWRMESRGKLLSRAPGGEEPCLKCHADKRGPFVFEHASLRVEGCGTCHVPHGSTNAKLLTRPVVFTMCLECHNGAGSFGRSNSGVPRQSASHNMLDPRYQQCTNCHVRIHGSNVDPTFLR